MDQRKNLRVLAECAILVALSVVLSFIKLFKLPLGGAVTLVSMLPVCVASVRHGVKKGAIASVLYAVFQLVFGIVADGLLGWGLTPVMLIGCMLFDYLIAFSVLCLAGLFRKKGELGIYAGFALAFAARFLSHFISGYVIFSNLEQWTLFGTVFENKPFLYSVCYNGMYMLPELVITLVVVVILMRIPYVKNKIIAPQD